MQYITVALSLLLTATTFANPFVKRNECAHNRCSTVAGDSRPTMTVTSTAKSIHGSPSSDCTSDHVSQYPNGIPSFTRNCLNQEKAKYFVDSFKNLLEYTDYDGSRGGPKGRGFNTNLAKKILAEDFQDFSDSINLLAQQPLSSITFPNRAAFIADQGAQPEVAVTILGMWFSCNTIAFRYRLMTGTGPNLPVLGLNIMELSDKLEQVKTQYAEFNSGAWLANLGNPECQKQGRNSTAATINIKSINS